MREAPFSLCLSLSLKIKERSAYWEILLCNFVPSLKKQPKRKKHVLVSVCMCACVYACMCLAIPFYKELLHKRGHSFFWSLGDLLTGGESRWCCRTRSPHLDKPANKGDLGHL